MAEEWASQGKLKRREFLKLAAGAAATFALAGCQSQPSSGPGQAPAVKAGAPIGKLTVAGQSLPRTLDPNYDGNLGASTGHRFLFDTLVTAFQGKPEPRLALSWQLVNPTTWRFKLREGVKFHNGEPFDAEAIKFTMDRILDPKGKSAWIGRFPTVERVNVVDNYTVDVVSKVPNAGLVNVMATIFILPPKYFSQVGEVQFNNGPIGTGPFRFKEWRPDVFLTMEGNKEYWDGTATVGELTLRAITEPSTRVAAIEAGEAQIAVAVLPEQVERLKGKGLQIQSVNIGQLLCISFRYHAQADLEPGPIKDQRVRRALAHATDVEGIHKALVDPWARMAQNQIYGPDSFGFNPNLKPWPYDPNKAKQLLADAGFPNGFTVHWDSSSGMWFREKEMTEAVLSQWAKLGIKVEVDYLETSRWMEKHTAAKAGPVFTRAMNSAPAFDAEFPLLQNLCTNPRRTMCNKEYDDLFYKQQQELDPEARRKTLWQIGEVLAEEVGYIPLYEQPSINALAKGLGNAQFNPEWSMYLHKATQS